MDPWTAVAFVVAHIPAYIAAWYAWKARKEVKVLHVQINSRVDELIAAARREGVTEGEAKR